jgi:CRISPR-associated protein Cmr4
MMNSVNLYLISPLHTGGTTQEGNLLGIARESHTNFPYIPSSTIRGKIRSITPEGQRNSLWGNTIDDVTDGNDENLTQGCLWIGDGSILWMPVPSMSHGVIWVSCPLLLERWKRISGKNLTIPNDETRYYTNLPTDKPIYLKDAIIKNNLTRLAEHKDFIPQGSGIERILILPDKHCATLIQMSLWRQVKIKLDEHKVVDGGFRYEEAIPPDTLMYFPWGVTAQGNGSGQQSSDEFRRILQEQNILQIGGQESLGRGFVQQLP